MQARLDRDGTLVITAQNDLESYALKKWSSDFGSGIHESKMLIEPLDDSDEPIEVNVQERR